MTNKQSILIAGATGSIGGGAAVAGESITNLTLSYQDRSAINGSLFKLDKLVEKPNKAMNDETLGKRLWNELVQLTGLTPE